MGVGRIPLNQQLILTVTVYIGYGAVVWRVGVLLAVRSHAIYRLVKRNGYIRLVPNLERLACVFRSEFSCYEGILACACAEGVSYTCCLRYVGCNKLTVAHKVERYAFGICGKESP